MGALNEVKKAWYQRWYSWAGIGVVVLAVIFGLTAQRTGLFKGCITWSDCSQDQRFAYSPEFSVFLANYDNNAPVAVEEVNLPIKSREDEGVYRISTEGLTADPSDFDQMLFDIDRNDGTLTLKQNAADSNGFRIPEYSAGIDTDSVLTLDEYVTKVKQDLDRNRHIVQVSKDNSMLALAQYLLINTNADAKMLLDYDLRSLNVKTNQEVNLAAPVATVLGEFNRDAADNRRTRFQAEKYAVLPSLPIGLTLNETTGAITGRTSEVVNQDYFVFRAAQVRFVHDGALNNAERTYFTTIGYGVIRVNTSNDVVSGAGGTDDTGAEALDPSNYIQFTSANSTRSLPYTLTGTINLGHKQLISREILLNGGSAGLVVYPEGVRPNTNSFSYKAESLQSGASNTFTVKIKYYDSTIGEKYDVQDTFVVTYNPANSTNVGPNLDNLDNGVSTTLNGSKVDFSDLGTQDSLIKDLTITDAGKARIADIFAQVTVDGDFDGVANVNDNCPNVANPAQTDTDADGTGDACDSTPNGDTATDSDSDGVANVNDNCPSVSNSAQTDTDADGTGDACDPAPTDPAVPGSQCAAAVACTEAELIVKGLVYTAQSLYDAYLQAGKVVLENSISDSVVSLTEVDTAIASAQIAVDTLTNSVLKGLYNSRLATLRTAAANLRSIIVDLANLDPAVSPGLTTAQVEAKIAEVLQKITALTVSPLRTELFAKLQEVAAKWRNRLDSQAYISITYPQNDPVHPVVTTTVSSDRVVLNLYRTADNRPVYTVDYHTNGTLLANNYVCVLGQGCNGWNGVVNRDQLPTDSYYYVAAIKVNDLTYRAASDNFNYQSGSVVTPQGQNYVDVPANHPNITAINFAYQLGVMRGSVNNLGQRLFRPQDVLLRTEVFAISNRLAGLTRSCVAFNPQADGNLGFVDLVQSVNDPNALWYLNEIKCSRQFGSKIVQGYPDATVRPLNQITWAESSKVVLESSSVGRVLKAVLPQVNLNDNPWWTDYYNFLERNSLRLPNGSNVITRAELAQFLYDLGQARLLDEPAIQSNTSNVSR